jgi:hypothetical protein
MKAFLPMLFFPLLAAATTTTSLQTCLEQATIFGATPEHLQPCDDDAVNVFIEDPWSDAIMHSCGATRSALANSCAADDVRFRDICVDAVRGSLFIATGFGIKRASLSLDPSASSLSSSSNNNLEDFVAGFTVVRLKGYNLGSSRADVVSLTIRGVECGTIISHNATALTCVMGAPAALLASPHPINGSDIDIVTVKGGPKPEGGGASGGLFVDSEEIAAARFAAGWRKPLVHTVDLAFDDDDDFFDAVDDDFDAFRPVSVAVDATRGRLFWASRGGGGAIQSCGFDFAKEEEGNSNVVVGCGQGMIEHGRGLGRLADLEVAADGTALYFTEANRGAVLRLALDPHDPDYGAMSRKKGKDFGQQSQSSSSSSSSSTNQSTVTTVVADGAAEEAAAAAAVVGSVTQVLTGLSEPWGLALDEPNKLLFVAEAGKGRILRVNLDGHDAALPLAAPDDETWRRQSNKAAVLPIVETSNFEQLSEIALLATPTYSPPSMPISNGSTTPTTSSSFVPSDLDTSPRLLWTETNAHRVGRASLHGTRRSHLLQHQELGSADGEAVAKELLTWPRAVAAAPLAASSAPSSAPSASSSSSSSSSFGDGVVYVAEYLGRVWEISHGSGGVRLLVDATQPLQQPQQGSAAQIRAFLAANRRASASPAGDRRGASPSFLRLAI